jgi:putative endonuclease
MTTTPGRGQTRWQVYILRCADGTLYTGIARDAERRAAEHNAGAKRGAKYTRTRRPVTVVYMENAAGRGAACRREHEIKSLPHSAKLDLIGAAAAARAARKRRARRRYP